MFDRRLLLKTLAFFGIARALVGSGESRAGTPNPQPAPAPAPSTEHQAALQECIRTTYQSSLLIDATDADGAAGMFTPDMEFVIPSTYPKVAIRGREELRKKLVSRQPGFISRHVCTNAVAEMVDPETVIVHSYFTHYRGNLASGAELPLPIADSLRSMGEYQDTLKLVNGHWLIARRVGRFIFGGL